MNPTRDQPLFEFSVPGARAAASAGQIDEWVHAFLTNDDRGANLPMAVGLRKQPRWWIGPIRVPLASLTRICGPEPGMAYRTNPEDWEAHISDIVASITDPELMPPFILEFRGPTLVLCDGNHRHEALRRCGEVEAWALVWCNTESEYAVARDQLTSYGG